MNKPIQPIISLPESRISMDIQRLLAVGSDLDAHIHTILARVEEILGVHRICIVPFTSSERTLFYCNQGADCLMCSQTYDLASVAMRLMPNPPQILNAQAIRTLTTIDLPACFYVENVSLLPLTHEENLVGAAFCCTDESIENEQSAALYTLCDLLAIALWNDISHKQALAQLEAEHQIALRQAADKAEAAKRDFLSLTAQELRAPISAILRTTRRTDSATSPTKATEALQTIDESATHLLSILSNIVDLSDFDTQKLTIDAKPFNLETLLGALAAELSPMAENKQQKLHIHMNVGVPFRLVGDEQRIRQVLYNLLHNAIKFTPEHGKILMNIQETERTTTGTSITFIVTDSGIGISAEAQKTLFTAFGETDGTAHQRYASAGLGLALCKKLTDLMEGQLTVRSTAGKGSTFTFRVTLPFTELPPSRRSAAAAYDLSKMSVLIADDEPETRAYFMRVMHGFKVRADSAASYAECLGKLQSADALRRPFDAVFINYTLSGRHLSDILQSIRDWQESNIIVLLPGTQTNVDESAFAQYNIKKFIGKPFFPSTLFDTILELSDLRPQEKSYLGSLQLYTGYNILLAEDHPINRDVLTYVLADTRATLHYAENGQIALDMFRESPELYDMILMDIHMPLMDGYEATRQIRMLPHPRAKSVPIVALTALADEEDIQDSLSAGMNAHLKKPLEPNKMLAVLQTYFTQDAPTNLKKAEPHAAPPADKKETESMNTTYEPPVEYVDVKDALGRIRNNEKLYKMLLANFLDDASYGTLAANLDENDIETAARSAHAIKGIAANLSFPALYKDVMVLEGELKVGEFNPASYQAVQASYTATVGHVQKLIETM